MFKNVYARDDMKRTEHMAVRKTAGWYLFTHYLVEVTGKDAAILLDRIYANPIGNLDISRARYTVMLNEDGIIRDDVVVFRLTEDTFWVSTLYVKRLLPWLQAHIGDLDVEFKEITNQWDMYSVQGPKALEVVNELVNAPVDDLKFFQIRDNAIDGLPIKVNRGGFTGEKLGYEVYVAPENSKLVVERLREISPKYDAQQVTDIQIMIWTLPSEKGFCLLCDLDDANPFEVGLDRGIGWDKDFIGKEALLKVKADGPDRALLGFTVEEEDIFVTGRNLGGAGSAVLLDGEEIGRVTKITYSYVLDKNIGFALVDTAKAGVGTKVDLHGFEGTLCDRKFI